VTLRHTEITTTRGEPMLFGYDIDTLLNIVKAVIAVLGAVAALVGLF
jgi:hypothetical protein